MYNFKFEAMLKGDKITYKVGALLKGAKLNRSFLQKTFHIMKQKETTVK